MEGLPWLAHEYNEQFIENLNMYVAHDPKLTVLHYSYNNLHTFNVMLLSIRESGLIHA